MKPLVVATLLLAAAPAFAQQPRIASDFEMAQMEKQAAETSDFASQLSAWLNIGDLRTTRNEIGLARIAYTNALMIAEPERTSARRRGDLRRYAMATIYAGLTNAKLQRRREALELLEEATRYSSDDERNWNLFAIAMSELRLPEKAVGAARHAVVISERAAQAKPSLSSALDLAIDRATLAHALIATERAAEAIPLLQQVLATLQSKAFDATRRDAAKREAFEVYSTAGSDVSAYVSLTNRAGLMLAAAYESRGDADAARKAYRTVLDARNDDAIALAGMARLTMAGGDAARAFAEAFDANPFSLETIADYQTWLRGGGQDEIAGDSTAPGAQLRLALNQIERGERQSARAKLEALLAKFPANDTINFLAAKNDLAMGDTTRAGTRLIGSPQLRSAIAAEIANAGATHVPPFVTNGATSATPSSDELRALTELVAQNRLTPEERVGLDRVALTSSVRFEAASPAPAGQILFEIARAGDVILKFAQPTAFNGTFAAAVPLLLTYRIIGATDAGGAQALLVEPLKLVAER